jgi:hypothetical protein
MRRQLPRLSVDHTEGANGVAGASNEWSPCVEPDSGLAGDQGIGPKSLVRGRIRYDERLGGIQDCVRTERDIPRQLGDI